MVYTVVMLQDILTELRDLDLVVIRRGEGFELRLQEDEKRFAWFQYHMRHRPDRGDVLGEVFHGIYDAHCVPAYSSRECLGWSGRDGSWQLNDALHYGGRREAEAARHFIQRFRAIIQEVQLESPPTVTMYVLIRLAKIDDRDMFQRTVGQLIFSARCRDQRNLSVYQAIITEIATRHGLSKDHMNDLYDSIDRNILAARALA